MFIYYGVVESKDMSQLFFFLPLMYADLSKPFTLEEKRYEF
jgi:hypothetical protein